MWPDTADTEEKGPLTSFLPRKREPFWGAAACFRDRWTGASLGRAAFPVARHPRALGSGEGCPEGEISAAKRTEAGRKMMIGVAGESQRPIGAVLAWRDTLLERRPQTVWPGAVARSGRPGRLGRDYFRWRLCRRYNPVTL